MGARSRVHVRRAVVAVAAALALAGCAARLGSVEWAIGDARVETCPAGAAPECRELVKGGTFSSVFGAFLGRLVDAAASVFGGSAPPTVVVAPAPPPRDPS